MYNKPWKTYLCDIVSRISTSAGLWLSEIVQFVKAGVISVDLKLSNLFVVSPSSETQGRSVGPGEKARRKFPSTGGKAPGYRLPPDHFQTVKRMLAPDWAQKMLCIIVPNRRTASPEFFSWVRTRRLLTRSRLVWLMHQRNAPSQESFSLI